MSPKTKKITHVNWGDLIRSTGCTRITPFQLSLFITVLPYRDHCEIEELRGKTKKCSFFNVHT